MDSKPLDTADTLKREKGNDLAGGLNPVGASKEVAGVAPHGTESVQGKDETEDFFRHMMESNEPVAGISSSCREWYFPVPAQ